MNTKIVTLLNEQINKEFFSAYLYLSFANYLEEKGLVGFAHWYEIQTQEERDHALLMVQFLQNNDGKLVYEAIKKPENHWENVLEVLKAGLAHEKYITASINDIYSVALDEKEYRITQFLDWFVKEQAEEETSVNNIIKKVEMIGDGGNGIYMLDKELALRVYTAPSLVL